MQLAYNSSISAMDKTSLIELVRGMAPLWDQTDKKYHNRCVKPQFWDETEEKLNFTCKY
jgi:hypothetical protein